MEILKTKLLLKGRSDVDLLTLPGMTDTTQLAAVRNISSSCALNAFQTKDNDLMALLMLREFQLSLHAALAETLLTRFQRTVSLPAFSASLARRIASRNSL
jgi:hypothetical protein